MASRLERPLQRTLHQIVGIGDIAGKRSRESAQPWQQRQQLTLECLQQAPPIMDETALGGRFIPMRSKIWQRSG
ncbi:MAG TPA: hypothetical protein VIT38_00590 [Allosphingosinicella sp.]